MIKELIEHELTVLDNKATLYIKYKQGCMLYGKFVLDYMKIEDQSSNKNPEEFVMDWLVGEKNNNLPITSSGSTINAILDEDGFINMIEGDQVECEDEILSYRCRDYISEEIDAIRTRVRHVLRASNNM